MEHLEHSGRSTFVKCVNPTTRSISNLATPLMDLFRYTHVNHLALLSFQSASTTCARCRRRRVNVQVGIVLEMACAPYLSERSIMRNARRQHSESSDAYQSGRMRTAYHIGYSLRGSLRDAQHLGYDIFTGQPVAFVTHATGCAYGNLLLVHAA